MAGAERGKGYPLKVTAISFAEAGVITEKQSMKKRIKPLNVRFIISLPFRLSIAQFFINSYQNYLSFHGIKQQICMSGICYA
jgi:hypothetical protein